MKQKTKKSAFKRIKICRSKLIRKKSGKAHLLIGKNKKRLRKLRQKILIDLADLKNYKKMLPFM
jgi:large subunit ribosomal protein L35